MNDDGFKLTCMKDVEVEAIDPHTEKMQRKALTYGLNLAYDWIKAGHTMDSLARMIDLSVELRQDPNMHGRFVDQLQQEMKKAS